MLDQKLIRENPILVENNLSLRGKVYDISSIHKLTLERKKIDIEISTLQSESKKLSKIIGKRNYSEKINKKMYKVAMKSIMSELIRQKRVTAIDKIELKEIKTKEVNNLLKKHKLQSVLIVTNSIDEKLFLSARNLKDVGIATVDYLDPALMLSFKNILIVKEAIEGFEKRFGG